MRTNPAYDDVIVRKKGGYPSVVYLLGTTSDPEQLLFRTRDEAVSKALAYATHQQVRAWWDEGADDFVLLNALTAEAADTPSQTAIPRATHGHPHSGSQPADDPRGPGTDAFTQRKGSQSLPR